MRLTSRHGWARRPIEQQQPEWCWCVLVRECVYVRDVFAIYDNNILPVLIMTLMISPQRVPGCRYPASGYEFTTSSYYDSNA